MGTATSASRVCSAPASASLCTATERMPSLRNVRMTRTAISPRLATRTVSNTAQPSLSARKAKKSGRLAGALREDGVGLAHLDQVPLLDRVAGREGALGERSEGAPFAARLVLAALLLGQLGRLPHVVRLAMPSCPVEATGVSP